MNNYTNDELIARIKKVMELKDLVEKLQRVIKEKNNYINELESELNDLKGE